MGRAFLMGGKVSMKMGGSRLPRGYTELAYIESNGAQYIDSGIYTTNNTKIEEKASTETGHFYAVSSASGSRFGLYLVQTGRVDIAFGGSGYKTIATGNTEPMTVILENGKVTINGTEYSFATQSAFTNTATFKLFSAGSGAVCGGRLYYQKIYEGSVLVRDFVPAMRDNDGAIGLYDLVNNEFYGNAGSGSFVGSEVAA